LNINTPEKGRAFSKEATDFLKEFEGESVELESEGFGKYGRVLGRLYGDGYINLEIVKLGLAHQYLGEKSELGDFKDAEDLARASELGLWKKSEYYGCLDVEINKKDEYVSITNGCAVDFKGWTVKDESTRNYVFPDVGSNVVLYSGEGVDAEGNLYWGRGKIWNDDKDSIFIRDDLGFLVYYSSYGY
jgi:hypothetical protein